MADAEKLYNDVARQPQSPSAQIEEQTPKAENDLASVLYPPEKPKAEFELVDEPADVLYGSPETLQSTYEPAMRESLDALAELSGVVELEQRQAMARDTSEIFSDARLSPQDASALHALLVQHAREGPVDDATLRQWTDQSMAALRERYGDSATARLEAAQEFVRNRPDLALILRSTGLGSNPHVVAALAENAPKFRVKPRVRKK